MLSPFSKSFIPEQVLFSHLDFCDLYTSQVKFMVVFFKAESLHNCSHKNDTKEDTKLKCDREFDKVWMQRQNWLILEEET